jgi:ketosteroid isomerase-like protein
MKRSSIVFLLLFVAIVSIAPAEGQDDKTVLTQGLNDYASAFHNFDVQRVLRYYHEPLIVIGGPAVRVMATRADTEAWMKSFWARLRERGYARGSEFSPLHVKQVSTSVAVASAQFVRYKADGQELERIGATYVLHKTSDGWKIVVVVGHDPGGVLRLD